MQRKSKATKLALSAILVVSIGGCQTTGEDGKSGMIGAGLGAVAGGLLGSQIGGGKGKIFAILGGAALGAIIGNQLAKYLTEEDQVTLAENTQVTAVSGEKRAWKNPDTGVSGLTEVKSESKTKTTAKVRVLKDRVQKTPPIDFINAVYIAEKTSNVRGGPGTDYSVVNKVRSGTQLTVLGKVVDEDWYMISENGVGSGYIYAPLLREAPEATIPTPDPVSSAPNSEVVEITIPGGQTCRIISQKVFLKDGSEQNDEVTTCNGPDGWQVV